MNENTKETREETRNATVEAFVLQVKRLLKENLVGWTEQKSENTLIFRLAGGQGFEITISETEKI